MDLNNEQLRDLSVAVVEAFINEKTPLDNAITKCAMRLEMNPEQTKRLVEASNTIAYLKLQKEAEDKTFEFPVADYNRVLGGMVKSEPDGTLTESEFIRQLEHTEKQAEEFDPGEQQKVTWLMKERIVNRGVLEKLSEEQELVAYRLETLAKELHSDPLIIEKLAEVCDEETFYKLSYFVTGSKEKQPERHVFTKEAELAQVVELADLYKKAQEIVKQYNERSELQKRADQQTGGLVGRTAGKTVGYTAKGTALGGLGIGAKMMKSKIAGPVEVLATLASPPKPEKNIWDNLQGTSRRY